VNAAPTAPTGAYWNRREVAERFRALAPPPYLRDLLAAYPASRPLAIALDAGCGAGRNLACLADSGYHAVGFDLHAGMLQLARRAGIEATVHQASILAIPLRDQCCDIVVCHGVLHNLASPAAIDRALRELARVTRSGGKISLNLFCDSHLDPCLTPTGQPDSYALPNGQRMTLLSPDAIEGLVGLAGLVPRAPAVTYLSPGDPGQRCVWRTVLARAEVVRPQGAACSS
jgi:SAM-dependent methyltransferase